MAETINVHALAHELAFEPDDVQTLASIFFKSTARALEALSVAVEAGDFDAIFKAAHSIKGSAGTLRLKALHACALEVEMAGRNNEPMDYGAACRKLADMINAIEVV